MLGRLLRRQVHVSYLVASLGVGICLGLVLAKVFGLVVGWVWLLLGLALVLSALKNRRLVAVFFVLIAGVLVGGQRGSAYIAELSNYQTYFGSSIQLTAEVADDPTKATNNLTQINLKHVIIGDHKLPGQVYATAVNAKLIKRGDTIVIRGKLDDGFGSFPAVLRRGHIDNVSRQGDVIRDLRESFASSVKSVARPNEAALGLGFVVGQRSNLPPDLDNNLRMIGLTHIVVASGYNLTILVRFVRRLFAKVSRFMATSLSGLMMLAFAVFSGFSASMNRAVLVTGLSLLAWHFGRRFHPLMLIVYTSAATAYLNPSYIWGDVGWYLSFLAFGGVLIVAPLISSVILRSDKPQSVIQVVIETIAAQIMTLPLILLVFGQLPNLAIIANALAAPMIPLSMLATTIAGLIGMLVPILGGVAGLLMHYSVGYVLVIVDWLSAIPGAQTLISLPAIWLALIYGLIVTASGLVWWLTRHDFMKSSVVD